MMAMVESIDLTAASPEPVRDTNLQIVSATAAPSSFGPGGVTRPAEAQKVESYDYLAICILLAVI